MNKNENGMNIFVKILLIIAGLTVIFSGINSLWISTGRESIVRIISSNIISTMKIIYALTGIGSLVTAIVLIIKIIKN